MANLLWPGDERAGDLFSDEAFLAAMVAVEEAWLDALAGSGIAPAGVAKLDLQRLVGPQHLPVVASASERGGNPAAALVERAARPRSRTSAPTAPRGCTAASPARTSSTPP